MLIIKYEEYLDIWETVMTELRDTSNFPTRSEKNLLRSMLYYLFGEGATIEGKLAKAVYSPWDALCSVVVCSLAVVDEHLDRLDCPDVAAFTRPRIEELLGYVVS
jgi:hypothetical protein